MSTTSFESALKSLDASLGQLEAAAQRKLDLERRRGDLETELAIMQDDRSRLATDLDGTLSRLRRVEGAADEAVRRLDRAMLAISAVLGDELGQDGKIDPDAPDDVSRLDDQETDDGPGDDAPSSHDKER
ncbi:MAG: DUF4164 domain-containing protein [Beijerinckiaceae bacterium]|nr:DUF4164 domain-containing protein [Beijerinckiaceae bacterium]